MLDMRLQYILRPLCLVLLIETWGCSHRATRRNYESFTLVTSKEKKQAASTFEKLVKETIKNRLVKKGYIYRPPDEYSDLKVVVQCETTLEKNYYISLAVNLDIYEMDTHKAVWDVSVSKMVRSQNIATEIIDPIVRQLTVKIPYAEHMGGIGVVMGRDLKIKDFSPKSPAKEAGLRINDLIVKVDKKEVKEFDRCRTMLKGEVNTRVELSVKRGARELNFIVRRISLNRMYAKKNPVKKSGSRNLKKDFEKRILQQP